MKHPITPKNVKAADYYELQSPTATFTAPTLKRNCTVANPSVSCKPCCLMYPDMNIGPFPAASATAWKNTNGTSLCVLLVSTVQASSPAHLSLRLDMAQHGFNFKDIAFSVELWEHSNTTAPKSLGNFKNQLIPIDRVLQGRQVEMVIISQLEGEERWGGEESIIHQI